MRLRTIRIAIPLLAAELLVASSAAGAAATTTATLTILAPPVEHVTEDGERRAASPGMNLREGDRVVTGPGGHALLTFLDGSTVTVLPGSEVGVEPPDDAGGSRFSVLIHAGKVWARIARWLGRPSGVSLASNEYTATARDGLIGAERTRDGGFVCWTRAGDLELADRTGRVLAVVQPEQKATVARGGVPAVQPFRVNASVLRVIATANVAPAVRMPGNGAEAGFTADAGAVNQVFGALTAEGERHRLIEVPAGSAGPYTVLVRGLNEGPFAIEVQGEHLGEIAYRHRLTGRIGAGEILAARIEQRLAGAAPHDPRTARVEDGRVTPLRPLAPDPPLALPGAAIRGRGASAGPHFVGGR